MEPKGFLHPLSKKHKKQLKSLGVYKKFINNVSSLDSGLYDLEDFDLPLKIVLTSAFQWKSSPEGRDFWKKIYNSL